MGPVINYEHWGNVVPLFAVLGGIGFVALLSYLGWKLLEAMDCPALRRNGRKNSK